MSTRFLVAKYIPDLRRMEPRNIGIVAWNGGRTAARFLGEDDGPPRYLGVKDRTNYAEWLSSWRSQLAKPFVEAGRNEKIDKRDAKFLDALREWSRGNYILVDGGELIEAVSSDELERVVGYLFSELVSHNEPVEAKEHEYQRLRTAAARVIKQSGLSSLPQWGSNLPTWYRACGVVKYFECDHVLGPTESPYSIYQRVMLSNQRTFESAAFQLYWFKESRQFEKERCAALVMGSPRPTKEQKENRQMLEEIATVVDVADEDNARVRLAEIASHNGHLKNTKPFGFSGV
jgi:hypothetical protein